MHERSSATATATVTAPDDQNTTYSQNVTSLRHKRELIDSTATSSVDDLIRTTESIPSTIQTIVNELNETIRSNETSDSNGSDSKETSSNSFYPRFHVTYWMFYPYSQVN